MQASDLHHDEVCFDVIVLKSDRVGLTDARLSERGAAQDDLAPLTADMCLMAPDHPG